MIQIDNIGYAVRSISKSTEMFESLGFSIKGKPIPDREMNLEFQFMQLGEITIELISPLDSNVNSAVKNLIEKQPITCYHTAYITNDLTTEIDRLKQSGFKRMNNIIRGAAFDYQASGCFLYNPNVGVIELIMYDKNK